MVVTFDTDVLNDDCDIRGSSQRNVDCPSSFPSGEALVTKRKLSGTSVPSELDRVKRLVVVAMFSDDELLEHLVLKGGNALDLVHRISTRASVDVDFSMADDFPGGAEALSARVDNALRETFRLEGYTVFDLKVNERPPHLTEDLADFWGGYQIEFKLIDHAQFAELSADMDQLRRNALWLGQGTRFLIDISRYEYTEGKEEHTFDGYRIYVYSVEMLVCEKLRAICQQMEEYRPVVKRGRAGAARARDFLDIYVLATTRKIDFSSPRLRELLKATFSAKRATLDLLRLLESYRDFHRTNFAAVAETVRPGFELKDFDFYFDFTQSLVRQLEALGDV